jgi:hypothetical protein
MVIMMVMAMGACAFAGELEELYLFTGDDDVCGSVSVDIPKGKKIEHTGLKVELIGLIEYLYDRGSPYEFSTLSRELEAPGTLEESKRYGFEFTKVRAARSDSDDRSRAAAAAALRCAWHSAQATDQFGSFPFPMIAFTGREAV